MWRPDFPVFAAPLLLLCSVTATFAGDESVAIPARPLPMMSGKAAQALYRGPAANCVSCHGRHGRGDGVLAARLEPSPRNFRDKEIMAALSDEQIFRVIREGRVGTAMPPNQRLTDEEVWGVVSHVRALAE